MTTTEVGSPLALELRAAQADQRAEGLEVEAREARREAAALRATAAAVQARDNAAAALAAAQQAERVAGDRYEAAGAAEREASRRAGLAEREAERAADGLVTAREAGAEPVELVELEERLAACRRVFAHEGDALARAEAARGEVRSSLDRQRERVRAARKALTEAEQAAENPTYTDPTASAGLFDQWIGSMVPGVVDRLRGAGIAGWGH